MNRHTLAHVALSAVYGCTGALFLLEGAIAHAIFAFVVALIYVVIGRKQDDRKAAATQLASETGSTTPVKPADTSGA